MKDYDAYDPYNARKRSVAKYLTVCSALTALNLYTGGPFWAAGVWAVWGLALLPNAIYPTSCRERNGRTQPDFPRRAFYRHLCLYLFVMGILAVLDYRYTPDCLWAVWPAGGWGLALALGAVEVFTSDERHPNA